MSAGIRARVAFDSASICPVAARSASDSTTITRVGGTVCVDATADCVSEFTSEDELDDDGDLEQLFVGDGTRRYRLRHCGPTECPCTVLGDLGCPIARYVAQDGTLTIAFHAVDYEELQRVVGELRDRFPSADIKRFVRSPELEAGGESVLVERGNLTERQREVLETALEMGYFDRPREANATEVAAALDITPSTFTEHLSAAQRKLLEDVLD
jgi:DNA-binding transcriptional ArsR family regulator